MVILARKSTFTQFKQLKRFHSLDGDFGKKIISDAFKSAKDQKINFFMSFSHRLECNGSVLLEIGRNLKIFS